MHATRCLLAVVVLTFGGAVASGAERPNIVVILADDLGFSDLGCYGGEIATPELDRLADGGVRFTQFYNTARCWPTRAALLTGYYAQQVRRDALPGVDSGGRGVRPGFARLLPEFLRPAGYRSYHSGKWHVDGTPVASGFDRSYWLQDAGRFFHPRVHYEDDEPLPAVEPESGYYATTAIANHAIRCLQHHRRSHSTQPFFHYVAFTSPHFPLHALPADIARYSDRYRAGWDIVRDARWRKQRELGLLEARLSEVERDVGPPYRSPESLAALGDAEVNRPLAWSELNDDQRALQATKMALHAAMVDRMDREIGRIVAQLRAMNALDNTLLFFLSDNGATAEILVRDDGHDRSVAPGSAATHFCLGPGWSTAANTPFRRHKTWVHEGGIATPLIVHWPRGIAARGALRTQAGHVIDLVPTILAAAGATAPAEIDGASAPPRPGKNLLAAIRNDAPVERDSLWWLHEGNRAIRVGDWKLVAAGADGPWELYNLAVDRSETANLIDEQPALARDLEQSWTAQFVEFRELATRDLDGAQP